MTSGWLRIPPRTSSSSWLASVALLLLGGAPAIGGQASPPPFTLGGEIRVRGEYDRRSAGVPADAALLLRTRLGVLASIDSSARAFIQLSDSRAFGEETNTLTDASANQFDLHQGYLDAMLSRGLRLRIGRQELAFADERLIGAVDWSNVSRAFDGVRGTWTRTAWTLDGFAAVLTAHDALLATGLDPRRNAGAGADGALVGAWFTSGPADVFLIGDGNIREGTRLVRSRYTAGTYLRHQVGRWKATGMLAWQGGRQDIDSGPHQTITAYLASAAVSYAWPSKTPGVLTAQADYLSGDASLADAQYSAFNTLYATNHAFYGSMDLFLKFPEDLGGLGLVDLVARLSLRPERWVVRADLHQFLLARVPSTGERAIGQELDLSAGRGVGKLGLQFGYNLFNPAVAAILPAVGLGSEVLHWAYLQLTGRF
jgi:hypothetical protein